MDGADADIEDGGDLSVALSLDDPLQHLRFSRRHCGGWHGPFAQGAQALTMESFAARDFTGSRSVANAAPVRPGAASPERFAGSHVSPASPLAKLPFALPMQVTTS